MHDKFTALAEAFPEDTYDWRPMEGVRSVKEVFALMAAEANLFPTMWGFEAAEGFAGYHLVGGEGIGVAGAVGRGMEEMPSYVTIYVQVASIDETLGKVEANGGSTIVPRTVIPDTVVFGLFTDPAGNLVGVVEPD